MARQKKCYGSWAGSTQSSPGGRNHQSRGGASNGQAVDSGFVAGKSRRRAKKSYPGPRNQSS